MTHKKKAVEASTPVIAYKGFDAQWRCSLNGEEFQYEIGKTYEHQGSVKAWYTLDDRGEFVEI